MRFGEWEWARVRIWVGGERESVAIEGGDERVGEGRSIERIRYT